MASSSSSSQPESVIGASERRRWFIGTLPEAADAERAGSDPRPSLPRTRRLRSSPPLPVRRARRCRPAERARLARFAPDGVRRRRNSRSMLKCLNSSPCASRMIACASGLLDREALLVPTDRLGLFGESRRTAARTFALRAEALRVARDTGRSPWALLRSIDAACCAISSPVEVPGGRCTVDEGPIPRRGRRLRCFWGGCAPGIPRLSRRRMGPVAGRRTTGGCSRSSAWRASSRGSRGSRSSASARTSGRVPRLRLRPVARFGTATSSGCSPTVDRPPPGQDRGDDQQRTTRRGARRENGLARRVHLALEPDPETPAGAMTREALITTRQTPESQPAGEGPEAPGLRSSAPPPSMRSCRRWAS